MRIAIFLIATIFSCFSAIAQKQDLRGKLYKLEKKIIDGDMAALKELGKYLDDKTFVQEFLGYHNYPNTAKGVAKRILEENCLLSANEFCMDSTITSAKFSALLNSGKVHFDELTGMFLITKINDRNTNYQIKQITDYEAARIDTTVGSTAYPAWYYDNQIDGFLVTKNPEVLMWIASAWFQKRSRFNRYYFNDEEFLDMMKKLTRIDLGVPDENGSITFLYEDDYYAKARLNYLIYWTTHCNDYKWNDSGKYFENIKEKAEKKSKEAILFELLSSENDSLALDAFSQLGELDTGRVIALANDYENNRADKNFVLPTFPFRFLKQMCVLTQFCRDNGIPYKCSGWVLDSLEKIKTELSYPERYRLENDIIDKLSIDEITQAEYYGLVNGGDWNLTYSLGRIVDKFYSKKIAEISRDNQQLPLYLKKAVLFYRLGIIGICRKYLKKFVNSEPWVYVNIRMLKDNTSDKEIMLSAQEVNNLYAKKEGLAETKKTKKEDIKKYGVLNFPDKYHAAVKNCKDEFECRSKLSEVLGLINYQQLGDVMKVVVKDTVYSNDELLSIIEGNFGIPASSLDEFFEIYYSKNEFGLYEFYLNKTGIPYKNEKGGFDYEKIYGILKYDIVDAFVGGGGGRRDEGIYPLIKLLELTFKTTLGFSPKLCDSGYPNIICGPTDLTRAWMRYLEEKGLVSSKKNEAVSISD
ncbi:MAG: hypothetical protein NTW29_15415 [Bacteroidetes bacterium]|nr:hypothetical protein [Bacteroidota bacterium]